MLTHRVLTHRVLTHKAHTQCSHIVLTHRVLTQSAHTSHSVHVLHFFLNTVWGLLPGNFFLPLSRSDDKYQQTTSRHNWISFWPRHVFSSHVKRLVRHRGATSRNCLSIYHKAGHIETKTSSAAQVNFLLTLPRNLDSTLYRVRISKNSGI